MSNKILKIKTTVNGVRIRGNEVPKGTVVDVIQRGEESTGKDIHEGVAKKLIFHRRAEAVKESPVAASGASVAK